MQRLVVLLLSICGLTGSAYGDPVLRMDVRGDCPTEAMLRASVAEAVVFSDDAPRWSVTIEPGRRRATLRISDAQIGSVLVREVRSKDCQAIAKAFAVIIHGYFVELHVLANPMDEPTEEPPAEVKPDPKPNPKVDPVAIKQKIIVPRPPPPAPYFWVGGGAGAISNDLEDVSPAANLRFGWTSARGLGASLDLVFEQSADQSVQDEVVERVATRVALSATYSRDTPGSGIRLAVGTGLALSKVTPVDLPGSDVPTRLHPYGLGSVGGRIFFGRHWALAARLEADVFFISDQYVIEPVGIIASSPRYSIFATLGIEWESARTN